MDVLPYKRHDEERRRISAANGGPAFERDGRRDGGGVNAGTEVSPSFAGGSRFVMRTCQETSEKKCTRPREGKRQF